MSTHNVVAFSVRFHGGPLDGLKAAWAEVYDGEHFRPRPLMVFATEHADEVIEVGRTRLAASHRYDVDTPGKRDLILECQHAP